MRAATSLLSTCVFLSLFLLNQLWADSWTPLAPELSPLGGHEKCKWGK